MNERNEAFDAIKGLLIVFVILGHVLLGSISENLGREIIYFFHMPLFLAVTGYFVKDTLLKQAPLDILKKYTHRMLIPFIVAFIFYTTVTLFLGDSLTFKTVVAKFLYPYYHLWYVPAVMLFIFYIKILESIPRTSSALVLVFFSLLVVFFEGHGQHMHDGTVYKLLGDKRFYYFFIYFYAGYYLSSRQLNIDKDMTLSIFVIGLLCYGYSDNAFLIGLGKSVANISMILLLLSSFKNAVYKSSFLGVIGKVSLPIYLWHVLPLIILKKLPISVFEYYSLSAFIFISFICIVVKFENKSYLLDKFLYGVAKSITSK
jgi:fucose 4-O-acetylase-like acetyltransferase